MQIKNPILTGFHADPCICRKGDDYYIAVSSFEWFPGIPVYHSRDMKHWELYTHVLTDEKACDLTRLPSAKGIWAPCLTYSEEEDLFYVVYGVMNSMNARYFDIDNYLITAKDIKGPWSEPVYLHSAGFDASLLHDTDGRKYLVSLDWETRSDYEKPGAICIVEYDPKTKSVVGLPRRIWRGGTDRGCLEAPHLTRHGEYYYLMCAEGGTGYYHSVTMARAKDPFGPYEGDPENPILTAVPEEHDERADVDHLKPRYFNPGSYLQKCGHGSYVETTLGEVYLVHLCARPFTPELRCTLGRETAIQKMSWTKDGWLRLASGGRLAETYVEGSDLPDWEAAPLPERDDFESEELGLQYCAPRIDPRGFCDLTSRPGWLRMRGQEAQASLNRVSFLARKLTSVHAEITTKMEFSPEMYKHSAGLMLYYDNMNYAYLRKYWSDTLGGPALSVLRLRNGKKTEYADARRAVEDSPLWLKMLVKGRESQFFWSGDGENWEEIGPVFDTSEFSDEYSEYGEFTGCFAGITCADLMLHRKCADFDFFSYRDLMPEMPLGSPADRYAGGEDSERKNMRKTVHTLSADLHEIDRSHNSYEQERREQESIRKGDLKGLLKSIEELEMERVGMLSRDTLRNYKDLSIVAITLSSRSAIEGGVSPETAFSMSDSFIQQIENLRSKEKVLEFTRKAQTEFCLAVRDGARSATDNPLILRCRDLISRRVNAKLSVKELADALNVNPSYLSQVFSREEKMPISDYIAREKVRTAAGELIFTEKSFAEIAALFSFSSQSHFGKVFKKWTSMTPKQYRTLYGERTNV